MLIQVAKYAVLIYISFSILIGNKKSGTPIFPDIESDKRIFQISACSGKCLTDNSNLSMTFDSCYSLCNKTVEQEHAKLPIKKVYENYSLNLLCREERSLVFTVKQKDRQLTPNLNYTKSDESSKDIFMININKASNADVAIVYLSNTSIFTISDLHPNTTYNISIAIVHSDYKYSIVTKDEQFTTLTRRYKPKEIQSIKFEKFDIEDNDDNMQLKLIVSWKPGSDMVCQYDILCHPSLNQDLTHAPIREPEALYTHTVKQLTFGTLYHIGIRAINSNDPSSESDFFWREFMTPTCLKWYDNNLTICPPDSPKGLVVEETQLSNQMFALNITWDPPELYPDYYILRILDLDELSTGAVSFKINKTENFVYIPNILINGSSYEVHLTAYSGGGNSSTMTDRSIEKKIMIDPDNIFILTASIITPIIGIGIMLLVVITLCHRREKLKRYQQRCRYFEELEKKAPADPKSSLNFATKTLPMLPSVETLNHFQLDLEEKLFFDDDMEIERGSVQVFEVLGEGAFGLVRRGIFKINQNEEKDVAVKMLKERPNIDDVRAFRREIEVMKSVGRHPNIVGILGHYTKDTNDLLLITEYCSKGNLLNFLRNEWQFLYKQSCNEHSYHSSNTPKIDTSDEKKCENAFNFDVSLIDKDPTKNYKSIEREMDYNENPFNNDIIMKNNKTPIPKLIAFNKSYGYNQICNSSCKCQVDILSSIVTSDENTPNNSNTPRLPLINVHNCECHKQNARSPLSVENRGYYRNFTNCKEKSTTTEELVIRHPLSTADLFMIAKQIALGMEFLSKNKVVHRDLAARNVLVSQDRTVKIADFGLSRDVYQENVYKKTGSGKLPIKWLALESLTHQVYTTQSDVWSFGILLYEIATLGGIPYPTIKTNRLMQLLKTGYRMEKPDNCNQLLYDLMLSCWHVNPNDRPNFSEICQLLGDMMNELPDNNTADNLLTENLKNCKNLDDETYLKPI